MSHGPPPDRRVVKEPGASYPPKSLKSGPIEAAFGLSDADLRLVLDAGEIGGWEWDIGTGVVRWSENLERIHGLAPAASAIRSNPSRRCSIPAIASGW